MPIALDNQVQNFSDTRIRPHSELARALKIAFDDDRASIDDVYNALNQQTPTWSDNRPDGPPHLLLPSDILAINAFMEDVRNFMANHSSWVVIEKACVRPAGQ